jgi:diguanylate cyclase (GGDEF)-like protein
MISLVSCLCLTLTECTALLVAFNLVCLAGCWWLPGIGIRLDAAAGLSACSALLLYGRYLAFRKLAELREANACLVELAMVDNLTGAYNRHYLGEEGNRIYHGFLRGGRHFSVILADIDGFKDINDLHGHAGGDAALIWFSNLLNGVLRLQDVAGRYGGDEFLIILPGTRLDEARQTAERLRAAIAHPGAGAPLACRGLRVSMGLAQVARTDERFGDVVEHADAALYQAKREGRDAIRIWHSEVREPRVCEA